MKKMQKYSLTFFIALVTLVIGILIGYSIHDQKNNALIMDIRDRAQNALRTDPKDIQNLILLGNMSSQLGENKKAEQAFKDVLAIEPNNITAHKFLAIHYYTIGNNTQSFLSIKKALKLAKATNSPDLVEIKQLYTVIKNKEK